MNERDDLVLDVRDVRTTFLTPRGPVRAVDGVSMSLRAGETLASSVSPGRASPCSGAP